LDIEVIEKWDKILLEIMKILPDYLTYLKTKTDSTWLLEEPLNIGMEVFMSSAMRYGREKPTINLNEIKVWKRFFAILFQYHSLGCVEILIDKLYNEHLTFDDSSFDLSVLQSMDIITSYFAVLKELSERGILPDYEGFDDKEERLTIKQEFNEFLVQEDTKFSLSVDSLIPILLENDQEHKKP